MHVDLYNGYTYRLIKRYTIIIICPIVHVTSLLYLRGDVFVCMSKIYDALLELDE